MRQITGNEGLARRAAGSPSDRWVLAALALCTLLPSLGVSIANVALPTLTGVFGATFQQVQWVVLAYLLATTTLIVSVGRLGDLFGRRRLMLAGVVLFTAASALCGVASSLEMLIAARAAQGLGAAILMALAMALVGDVVPKARTGSAMGLLGTMSAIGTALGPSLGGWLIASFDWRAIFFVNLPLGAAALYLVARQLPAAAAGAKANSARFDAQGTLWLALTLAAYALALTLGRGHFGALNVALLAAAAVGAAVFVRIESHAAFPLIRLERLRDPALRAGLVTSALVSTVLMATLVVGPFYLARGLGLGTALVGTVMSVGPAVAALTGVPAGRAVDRFGARRAMVVGLVGMVLGCVALSAAPATFGIAGYLVPIVIVTAHYALFQAANNTAVLADAAPDQRGVISALLNLARNLGLVTGAAGMGAIFALVSGTSEPGIVRRASVEGGMGATFAVAAALLVLALAVAVSARAKIRTAAV